MGGVGVNIMDIFIDKSGNNYRRKFFQTFVLRIRWYFSLFYILLLGGVGYYATQFKDFSVSIPLYLKIN